MDRYLVVGHPIAHSKSPLIHGLFAEQTGETLEYSAQDIAPDQFDQQMQRLFDEGLKGANVTVPFKADAYRWADRLTMRAQCAGAVNTLILEKGSVLGDNTDGMGMINDIIKNIHGELSGKRVLIVGAGGAVRGVLAPLFDANPKEVVIVNRTFERANALKTDFANMGAMTAYSFDDLRQHVSQPFDWIINGTSTGLTGACPPLPTSVIGPESRCYDMFYSDQITPFNVWCQQQGAQHCYDGLGMLIEQAAEAFFLWRGVRPETESVIRSVRGALFT